MEKAGIFFPGVTRNGGDVIICVDTVNGWYNKACGGIQRETNAFNTPINRISGGVLRRTCRRGWRRDHDPPDGGDFKNGST